MGKVEIDIYFCVTADILKTSFTEMFLEQSSTNLMNFVQIADFDWLPWQPKGKFSNKYSKMFFSEAIRGIKLKLCINVHDISLYINYIFFLSLPICFRCYDRIHVVVIKVRHKYG